MKFNINNKIINNRCKIVEERENKVSKMSRLLNLLTS